MSSPSQFGAATKSSSPTGSPGASRLTDDGNPLGVLNELAVSLFKVDRESRLPWFVAREVVARLGFVDCVIYFLDPERQVLRPVAASGAKNPQGPTLADRPEITVGTGITGRVAASGTPILAPNLAADPRYVPDLEPALSEVCVPVVVADRVVGVIDCEDARAARFDAGDLEILTSVAAMMGAKLELLRQAQELSESQARLAAVLDHAPVPISLKDPAGRYRMVNPEWCATFGVDAAAATGHGPMEMLPAGMAAEVARMDAEVRDTGQSLVREHVVRFADGERVFLVVKFPVQDQAGRVTSIGTISTDMTEQKRHEAARRESDERFRSFFNLPLVGSTIHAVRDKRWIAINDAFCHMVGYDRDELMDLTWVDLTHPDDVAENLRLYQAAVSGAGPDAYTMDKRFIAKDGSIVHAAIHAQCIRGADGRPAYVVLSIQNTNEQRRVANILNEAVESLSEAFALYDEHDRLVVMNRKYREIYGQHADSLRLGRTFEEMLREGVAQGQFLDAAGREEAWIAERVETHRNPSGPVEQRLPGGRWLRAIESRTPSGFIAGLRLDVTEEKRIQEALSRALVSAEEANQAKSEFLATMSHELRTPLNAILGFADVLTQQYLGPIGEAKYLEYARDIRHSGGHLLDLVNDLLDLSKIETGDYTPELTAFDFAAVVDDAIQVMRGRATETGVEIGLDLAADLAPLVADRRAIKQVLLNLLSNALKFTPGGGRVTVTAWADAAGFRFSVHDTGPGIAAEQLARLNGPFGRAESDPFLSKGGAGLGLPITRSLIQMHGGTMGIESEPGQGTTITAHLPRTVG